MLSIKAFAWYEFALVFRKYFIKNIESWLYKHLSKTFDKFDNILIGL